MRIFSFFFQAEDGIRDLTVTGVQTCALPIAPATWPFIIQTSLAGGVSASQRGWPFCLYAGDNRYEAWPLYWEPALVSCCFIIRKPACAYRLVTVCFYFHAVGICG